MDNSAFFTLTSGLFIVTCKHKEKLNGCIVNTVMQVSNTPNKLSVAINKDNLTSQMIIDSKKFIVNVLAYEVSMDTIATFGFESGKTCDKFKNIDYDYMGDVPFLTKEISATFLLTLDSYFDVGTHYIFVGTVEDAKDFHATPLTYSDYHNIKKGTTPKNAPNFIGEENLAHGYKCSVCNYIEYVDNLDKDFICPVCNKDASYFVKF